jgi:hypothetical protein
MIVDLFNQQINIDNLEQPLMASAGFLALFSTCLQYYLKSGRSPKTSPGLVTVMLGNVKLKLAFLLLC